MEEDCGERDEGEQLDTGSPGTTSTRQKPMGHFDQGLMCFETRRGLSKYDQFDVCIIINEAGFSLVEITN